MVTKHSIPNNIIKATIMNSNTFIISSSFGTGSHDIEFHYIKYDALITIVMCAITINNRILLYYIISVRDFK
jgi:hypothetical protein